VSDYKSSIAGLNDCGMNLCRVRKTRGRDLYAIYYDGQFYMAIVFVKVVYPCYKANWKPNLLYTTGRNKVAVVIFLSNNSNNMVGGATSHFLLT